MPVYTLVTDNVEENVELLKSLLIGEHCFGDDGENATISNVHYAKLMDKILIDIKQENGASYVGFDLANYLDSIDTDDETMDRVREILKHIHD